MHKKHGYQPTSTITMQPPRGGSSVSRDFDSFEQLAFDMLQFIEERIIPVRGNRKNTCMKFVERYAKLKGWL